MIVEHDGSMWALASDDEPAGREEAMESKPDARPVAWKGPGQWRSAAEAAQDGEPEDDDEGDDSSPLQLARVRPYLRRERGRTERVGGYVTRRGAAEPDEHGWIPPADWMRGQQLWKQRGEAIWERNEWKRRAASVHFTSDIDTHRAAEMRPGDRVLLRHPATGRLRPAWVKAVNPDGDSVRVDIEQKRVTPLPYRLPPSKSTKRISKPITETEARGNSRPVTMAEFQHLANLGRNMVYRMKKNATPITGLDNSLDAITDQAWEETRSDWGGITVDAHTGEAIDSHADRYAMSVKPAGMHSVSVPENASEGEFAAAMRHAVEEFRPVLERRSYYLGVFHDNDNHRIDIDPVVVVDTPREVEAIGAYAHSVGGAYHFSDGMGYFPPHVSAAAEAGLQLERNTVTLNRSAMVHLLQPGVPDKEMYDTPDVLDSTPEPDRPQVEGVQKMTASGMEAGDTFAWRAADGTMATGTITRIGYTLGGRVAEFDVRAADGSVSRQLFTADAAVYRLPDLPDDKPLPPPGQTSEHITPDRLRAGDTILWNDQPAEVTRVEMRSLLSAQVWIKTPGGESEMPPPITSKDGSPVIIRVARGAESAGQPWNVPAADEATEINANNIYMRLQQATASIVHRLAAVPLDPDDTPDDVIGRLPSAEKAAAGAQFYVTGIVNDVIRKEYWDSAASVEEISSRASDSRERLQGLVNQMAEQLRNQVIDSIRNTSPKPGESARDALGRTMIAVQGNVRLSNSAEISRALAQVAEDIASAPAGAAAPARQRVIPASLSDRSSSYPGLKGAIDALAGMMPATETGKTYVERATFEPPTLESLQRGQVPKVTTARLFVPDRAGDGGPGSTSMFQNAVIHHAGQLLDGELQRRLGERQKAAESAYLKLQELRQESDRAFDRWMNSMRRHNVAQARKLGLDYDKVREALLINPLDEKLKKQLADINADTSGKTAAEAEKYQKALRAMRHAARELDQIKNGKNVASREEAIKLLQEVRPDTFGGDGMLYQGNTRYTETPSSPKTDVLESLRWAESNYPQTWLALGRQYTPDGYATAGPVPRGDYTDGPRKIRLSDYGTNIPGAPGMGRVATHELGHVMERAVPGLTAMENAEIWRRTSTGRVGSRTQEDRQAMSGYVDEYSHEDRFREPYSGKDYGGDAFELFTTGVESLFAGSDYLDDEFRQWMLGTMALMGREGGMPVNHGAEANRLADILDGHARGAEKVKKRGGVEAAALLHKAAQELRDGKYVSAAVNIEEAARLPAGSSRLWATRWHKIAAQVREMGSNYTGSTEAQARAAEKGTGIK